MDYVPLGRSGLKVSPLCLGTMMFGGPTDEQDSGRIIATSREAGINFIDTADVYVEGRSEEITGRAIAPERSRWVLATKVCNPMGEGPNDRGLSRRWLMLACEASLRRLGTDWIDVYYLHKEDHSTPLEETVNAVGDLIRQGKIRYLGLSNFRAWRIAEIVRLCDRAGIDRPLVLQPYYNALNRMPETELLPACAHYGLGVVPYSPLARGVLTGKYDPDAPPPTETRAGRQDKRMMQTEWRRESLVIARQLKEHAESQGHHAGPVRARLAAQQPARDLALSWARARWSRCRTIWVLCATGSRPRTRPWWTGWSSPAIRRRRATTIRPTRSKAASLAPDRRLRASFTGPALCCGQLACSGALPMPSEKAPVLAAAIRAGGRIAEDDVRALRRAIWGDGQGVGHTWATTLLALHREVPDRAGSWAELYREALIEFFLDGRGDETVDEPAADMLLREIASDGVVADTTELRLLLDLVFRARHCPARLVAFARNSLLASIARGTGPLSGKGGRQPGVIDADEVEAIRHLVYGSGGADGMQVGEAEALWLVDLDRATAAADNVPDLAPALRPRACHVPAARARHG